MTLSVVIPVLDSHEVVRRQLLHFERIGLPDDVELILVDDGSDPPIRNTSGLRVTIHYTNDKRPWTWPLARNAGAKLATGEYLLMTDIDHIITSAVLQFARTFRDCGAHFVRRFGVLDEQGFLRTDEPVLREYGLRRQKLRVESHTNSFVLRRDVFWKLGGYVETLFHRPQPSREDTLFFTVWKLYFAEHGLKEPTDVPVLRVFPTGRWCGDVDFNPHGLFHNLTRKSTRNHWWNQQRKRECQTALRKT